MHEILVAPVLPRRSMRPNLVPRGANLGYPKTQKRPLVSLPKIGWWVASPYKNESPATTESWRAGIMTFMNFHRLYILAVIALMLFGIAQGRGMMHAGQFGHHGGNGCSQD